MANESTGKQLLSGNEAVAIGAIDAGASVGTGYPGTPSTETLEAFAKDESVYAEWCANEKVALEVAIGASMGGARTLTTMKHVGVNVAADPLFTAAYTGVGGGMAILAADDPGMHSSQNEQDSRYYALAAHIPALEPADSQEAYDFAREAYSISEEFDLPTMIRTTVRISHTRTPVVRGEAEPFEKRPYQKDSSKWVMMPLYAKVRRKNLLERMGRLQDWVEETSLNQAIEGDPSIGIICAGAVFQHVREALPNASVFKLGVTYPLPKKALEKFRSEHDKVYVVEEASTYLADSISALGIELDKIPGYIPPFGELDCTMIETAFDKTTSAAKRAYQDLPPRPPALCAGCPHRVVFKELARQRAIVTGDIGCYTLGALKPLDSIDSVVDMGASISMAHGMELALNRNASDKKRICAVIGDSTFAHSGITSLATTVYNSGAGLVCILDNRTTAMTGRQGNPFNGDALDGAGVELSIEDVVASLGVNDVRTVDPNDVAATRAAIKEGFETDELTVIVFRAPCVLLSRERSESYHIEDCTACGVCLSIGCPAIGRDADTGIAHIDASSCIGCGQCSAYCKFGAIRR